MYEQAKRWFLGLVRLPHDPATPAGSKESVQVFRASPRLYQLNLIEWACLQFVVLAPALFALGAITVATAKMPEWLRIFVRGGLGAVVLLLLLQLLVTFWMQKLDYEMRWYIVTDRSLRIRSGVWSVKEITMTFANVQQVRVSQGPLQKLLDMATVEVSSAGGGAVASPHGGAGGGSGHSAQFEGVANAHEIRDVILERLRQYRDAGLGDSPSVAQPVKNGGDASTERAAKELLKAAQELHVTLRG